MRSLNFIFFGLVGVALGHGDHEAHSQKPIVDDNANWMTKHMAEEHHISSFDAASFFNLHDYNSDGRWEPEEIERTYGLADESNAHVSAARRGEIVQEILALMDANRDGHVDRAEFERFLASGRTLPDMGTGPGHHGDDEYEYDIHHWEKYHDENTRLEDLTHPEDIAHFKKHEEMEEAEERLEAMERMRVVEENIPGRFRRDRQ